MSKPAAADPQPGWFRLPTDPLLCWGAQNANESDAHARKQKLKGERGALRESSELSEVILLSRRHGDRSCVASGSTSCQISDHQSCWRTKRAGGDGRWSLW